MHLGRSRRTTVRGVDGVAWNSSGGSTWLTGPGGYDGPVVAGLTVDTGFAQQDPRQLGVAPLVVAWLCREVAQLGEAVDGPGAQLRVSPALGQSELTVMLSGSLAAVGEGMLRLEAALSAAGDAVVDDDLRSRARLLVNPLSPWTAHLAARWRGQPFVLSALGPLALDTVDVAAMADFVRSGFAPSARLFWTTEPRLAPVAVLGTAGPRDRLILPPAAAGPGCVLRRNDGETASTVADPFDPAGRVALSVLAAALHRRLVEFQPLAAAVELRMHPLPGRVGLVTCVLVGGQSREATVRAAVSETLEDLAGCSAAEIDRIRRGLSAESAGPPDPGTLAALARRQLVLGDEPTPWSLAREVAEVADEEVRDRLGALHRHLLLAVSAADDDLPYPMAEPVDRPPAEGRRYPSWGEPGVQVRCSPRRVGRVRSPRSGRAGRGRPTTLAAVDFDQVVLRIDAGGQTTALLDADLAGVRLVFASYRQGERLRRAVHERTAGVPLLRAVPRPEVDVWLDDVVRRRRRSRIGLLVCAAVLAVLLVGTAIAGLASRQRPVQVELAVAEQVQLANGSTLAVVGGPDRVVRTSTIGRPALWAIEVRMCGGGETRGDGSASARNVLSPTKFALVDGERIVTTTQQIGGLPDRPPLPDVDLDDGECAQGWLAFPLSGQRIANPRLRYSNLPGDRVFWRLPAVP